MDEPNTFRFPYFKKPKYEKLVENEAEKVTSNQVHVNETRNRFNEKQ